MENTPLFYIIFIVGGIGSIIALNNNDLEPIWALVISVIVVACGIMYRMYRNTVYEPYVESKRNEWYLKGKANEKELIYSDIKQKISILLNQDFFIIDSNIWMLEFIENSEIMPNLIHSNLEELLVKLKKFIEMPGFQFDEICKTKNKEGVESKAKLAMLRIENLQTKGLLKILNLKSKPVEDSYADPKLIELILRKAKENKSIGFFTNDIDLRVRLRGVASSYNLPEPYILSSYDFPTLKTN